MYSDGRQATASVVLTLAAGTLIVPPVVAQSDCRSLSGAMCDERPVLLNRGAVIEALAREHAALLDARPGLASGRVFLWLQIDAAGTVTRTREIASVSDSAFVAAARRVAGRMRFRPALASGRAMAAWLRHAFTFEPRRAAP